MAVLHKINNIKHSFQSRVRFSFIIQQRCSSSISKVAVKDRFSKQMGFDYSTFRGRIDISKWKQLDARSLGITDSMISRPSWTVLRVLRANGFESYLVGGCVRDLILNRIPKDFDVITTAKLTEIRRQFRRAIIVGRHFPICLVHIKDSVIEVSSFETSRQTSQEKERYLLSLMPKFHNKKDLIRCKNSLHRDFTVNSLFYDPFAGKIYDYANGMADLRSMKLQTVIPAKASFKEDPGRILRALRIAARLGLSLSREIEAAIRAFSLLVKDLNKEKIMIELDYMLSYGAAEPSLSLLWKFKLLEFLLPFHAAYLDQQATKQGVQAPSMFLKLFFHLDKLVACDRPSVRTIWVGLLAFHLTLVNNPQDALVVWTFASVLYHGEWEQGVKFAKAHAEMNVNFAPEIRRSFAYESDEEIAKAVAQFTSLLVDSISALVDSKSLLQFMSRYPSSPCSGMVLVSKKLAQEVAAVFYVLVNDVESYRSEKDNFEINHNLLGMGHKSEIRFVVGKVILETMSNAIVREREVSEASKEGTNEKCQSQLSDSPNSQLVTKKDKGRALSASDPEHRNEKHKKQKLVENESIPDQKMSSKKHNGFFEKLEDKETKNIHTLVNLFSGK